MSESAGLTIGGEGVLAALPQQALDRKDGPLYRQLASLLREPIRRGAIVAGAELPREADLAARFGVSLITVREALRELEGDGLIRKRAAKTAIVTGTRGRGPNGTAFQTLGAIAASTRDRWLDIHSYRKERNPHAARMLGLAPGLSCHCLRATLREGGVAIGQTSIYFPPTVGGRLVRSDFDDVVVFRSVQRHLGIALSGAQITVRAETADEALAAELDYEPGGAILAIEMLYRAADGSPVEYTVNRNRADLFSLSYDAPNDLV